MVRLLRGRKLDFYKTWLLPVCVHVQLMLNTEGCCDSLGRRCYRTCSHTHMHTDNTAFQTLLLVMSGSEEHILLDVAHTLWQGDLCVCLLYVSFCPFFPSRVFWSFCRNADSSQFASKPARLCLYKFGFEKFTVQLCRLNIFHTVFTCVHHHPPPQSGLLLCWGLQL